MEGASSSDGGKKALALIRPDLASVNYKGVESIETIAKEIGMNVTELVKLDANENAYGTPEEVKAAIVDNFHKLHIYPDPSQALLRDALVKYLHPSLKISNVVCGAGSDDLLDIVIRLFDPQHIIISTPTFGMYSFLGKLARAKIVDVPRDSKTFDIDVEAICAAVKTHDARLVFLPSPNNPTGNVITFDDIKRICQENCILVVDEAYIDFAAVPSAEELLKDLPNLIVCRTFSKWAGLAGVRIGYALAHEGLVERMMAIKQPYNVNCVAEAGAISALQSRDKIMKTVDALRLEKDRLHQALKEEEPFKQLLEPLPSRANFVLCRVKGKDELSTKEDDDVIMHYTAPEIAGALRRRGILIRYFGQQGGDILQNYIRISAGRPQDTDKLLQVLRELLLQSVTKKESLKEALGDYSPEGIIFDMDGVLADVSRSYREAILKTAATFGAPITGSDIAAAKAKGKANNDWVLTHRLIGNYKDEHPVPSPSAISVPSLEEVTARFEEFYQGTLPDSSDGLWKTESLLVNKSLLEQLAAKYPLAIVTGRPRTPDAERFLKDHDIAHLFKAVVCMEDTPLPKPDPAPVKLALDALGISRAVMIGDTPDDVNAAVAAGIKAIGVVAPGVADVQADENVLMKTGAFIILNKGLPELSQLL